MKNNLKKTHSKRVIFEYFWVFDKIFFIVCIFTSEIEKDWTFQKSLINFQTFFYHFFIMINHYLLASKESYD